MPGSPAPRVGVWVVGALGDLATTLLCGTLAMRRGLVGSAGVVTALPPFAQLGLVDPADLVFGGVDVRERTLDAAVDDLYRRSRTLSAEVRDALADELAGVAADIAVMPELAWSPAARASDGPSLQARVDALRARLRAFRERHRLQRVVVVHLASAEPAFAADPGHADPDGFAALLAADAFDRVAPSAAGAWAAFQEGCPFVNFTPNAGATLPALARLAERAGLPHAGNDGKTGETLVKTALAPMFAARNLQVLSWEGVNLLGNNDGRTLADPANRGAKLANKGQVLEQILGYAPHAGVTIDYVPSLGDWKTAWDLVHFRGFLDVPMTMQFTWQGCDSVLAAPLVLDLVRLAEFAARHGEAGALRHAACFFKNPIGVSEMALQPQFDLLLDYARRHLQRRAAGAGG